MATNTWQNGGVDHNWNTAGNWSDGIPTADDDVVFPASTGWDCTINAAAVCRSLDASAYDQTLTHAAAITLSIGDGTAGAGNVALAFGASMTYGLGNATTSAISFVSTSTTQQAISFDSKVTGNVTFNGAGGSWILSSQWGTSSVNTNQTTEMINGTLNTNNQICHWGALKKRVAGTCTLTGGNSTLNLWAAAASDAWYHSSDGFTWNYDTSTIVVQNGGNITCNRANNWSFYDIQILGAAIAGVFKTGGSVHNLTRTGSNVKTDTLSISMAFTVTGTLTITGYSAISRLLLKSNTIGTARIITTAGATVTITNTDLQDITLQPAAASGRTITAAASDGGTGTRLTTSSAHGLLAGGTITISGTTNYNGNKTITNVSDTTHFDIADTYVSSQAGAWVYDLTANDTELIGDCGGNTGIRATTADTMTWNNVDGGAWHTAANWTATVSSSRVPLPQDSVRFGTINAERSITDGMPRVGDCSFAGASNPVQYYTGGIAVTYYGNLDLTGARSISVIGGDGTQFIARSNQRFNQAGITVLSAAIAVYALNGSTFTLDAAYTNGKNLTLQAGTLSTQYDVTAANITTAAGTTLDMGTAATTWAVTTYSTFSWNVAGSVVNGGSTVITVDSGSTNRNFFGGANTYNKISVISGAGTLTFSGAFTFTELSMADNDNAETILFAGGYTYTWTGTTPAQFLQGAAGKLVTIGAATATSVVPIINKSSAGTISLDYISIQGVNVTPADTWYYGANSLICNGLSFGATTDRISIANSATANQISGATSFSLEAWFVCRGPGGSNTGTIFRKATTGTHVDGYILRIGAATYTLEFYGYDTASRLTRTTAAAISINTITHVVMSWTNASGDTKPDIYVNGSECTYSQQAAFGTPSDDSALSLYMGGHSNGHNFDGVFLATRIYRGVALSSTDVTTLYNAGPKANNPMGNATSQYLLNEGTGTTATDDVAAVNGVITNADWVNTGWQAASSIKTIIGLLLASVKTVDGLAIASVKTVDGLA